MLLIGIQVSFLYVRIVMLFGDWIWIRTIIGDDSGSYQRERIAEVHIPISRIREISG